MKRETIDFHAIPPHQDRMHERLLNWALWVHPKGGARTSPMFRLYRSDEHREGVRAASYIDAADGQKIEHAVAALPFKHGEALRWSYVVKCSPVVACRLIACTLVELAQLVTDARQMLVNRDKRC
jgi:hypothetical protein